MRKIVMMSGLMALIAAASLQVQANEMPKCERNAAVRLHASFPATTNRLKAIDCDFRGTGRPERVKVCKMMTDTNENFVVVLSESCDKTIVVFEDGISL